MKRSAIGSLVVVVQVAACHPGSEAGGRQGVPWDGREIVDDLSATGEDSDDGDIDVDDPGATGPTGCVDASSATGCDPSSDDDIDDIDDDESGDPSTTNPTTAPDPDGWDPSLASREDEMLVLVNDLRSRGADCGGATMPPVPPLTMNQALRSAARHHSQDMADNGYFDHNSLDGRSPWDRMAQAGYDAMPVAENIAAGSDTAAAAFDLWVHSPGHCQNMMSPYANEIGVGTALGGPYGAYWTQTFGAR
jgi:uncharacterized protein YkwD